MLAVSNMVLARSDKHRIQEDPFCLLSPSPADKGGAAAGTSADPVLLTEAVLYTSITVCLFRLPNRI